MPMLSVKCKKCGTLMPTGTEMSYETFRNATFQYRTIECPKCESLQTWTPDDVDRSVFKDQKT